MKNGCVFCEYEGPSEIIAEYPSAFVIKPLHEVVPGHRLIVSKKHVRNAAESAGTTAFTFSIAARYAAEQNKPFNLITSGGEEASQTVFHLHVHYLPRAWDDGMTLPWTNPWESPSERLERHGVRMSH